MLISKSPKMHMVPHYQCQVAGKRSFWSCTIHAQGAVCSAFLSDEGGVDQLL
jgi:hypothetical protein